MPLDEETRTNPASWGVVKPYFAVFLVTAVAVYGWVANHRRPVSPEQGGTARAVVSIEPATQGEAGRQALPLPNAEALRSQIVTEENIARALVNGDDRWSVPQSVQAIRSDLQVTAERKENPESVTVSLALANGDLRFASGVVNALGERYAEGCRVKLRDDVRRAHELAAEALGEARQKARHAKAELDGFLERHFREHEELARRTMAASRAGAASPQPTVVQQPRTSQPVPVENPEWQQLQGQVQLKRRALVEMLAVRTPLHPDAQALQTDISELERRLLATPRQILRPADDPPVAQLPANPGAIPSVVSPVVSAQDQLEAVQTFTALSGELRRAAEEEGRLAGAERLAWQEQLRLPNVKMIAAVEPTLMAATAGAHVLWVALIAAAAVTSGVGMIFSRPGVEPRICSVLQAEQTLGVPVLGIVRAADLPEETAVDANAKGGKLVWVLCGLVCIAGALTLVLASA